MKCNYCQYGFGIIQDENGLRICADCDIEVNEVNPYSSVQLVIDNIDIPDNLNIYTNQVNTISYSGCLAAMGIGFLVTSILILFIKG